jgi:phospholipase/lecithinase/hemolysin
LGARNFLLLDIPDISGSPEGLLKTTADRRAFREFIDTYNRELHSQAERFRAENEVVLFNVFSPRIVAEEILDRPAAYGITNTTAACLSYHAYDGKEDWNTQYDPDCGAPVNEFFWRDNIHPTSIVHREWGRRLAGYLQTQGPQ